MPVAAVVGTVAGIAGAKKSRDAAKDAADDVEDANRLSATQLAAAGKAGRNDIRAGARDAEHAIKQASIGAGDRIYYDAENGKRDYDMYQSAVLNDSGLPTALGDAIANAGTGAVNSNVYDINPALREEINRQGKIAASSYEPTYRNTLLSRANTGVSAVNDFTGIKSREQKNLAKIAAGEGAQTASALIGQTSLLQQLGQGATEARALGNVASNNFKVDTVNNLASLAGQIRGVR